MSQKLSIKDLNLKNQKVLVRVDFNVPLDKAGRVADDTRIRASIPTIQYILDHQGKPILMSHLGRPKKKDPSLSLKPVAEHLQKLLNVPVKMAPGCIGSETAALAENLTSEKILMLENLRFHEGEEHPEKDPNFVKELAKLGDLYVNDAFGSAHRAHASTAKICDLFPESSAMGLLLQEEIEALKPLIDSPKHPFHVVLGGAKISTKFGLIKSLMNKADAILIGGAMAYTFLKAKGEEIGGSLYEEEFLEQAKELIENAEKKEIILALPIDHVVTNDVQGEGKIEIVRKIPKGFKGVDIGPETIEEFQKLLSKAKTILWNGPMGVFENPKFSFGTEAIAQTLAKSKAETYAGGGDSVAALEKFQLQKQMSHVSTGGGALLEYLEYGSLPGIDALSNKKI